ncbi:MAG: hypothetical protein M3295_01295 [Chloroflexota bacterium]|nr:hypothetical protein [Chloroflexota bacterium]
MPAPVAAYTFAAAGDCSAVAEGDGVPRGGGDADGVAVSLAVASGVDVGADAGGVTLPAGGAAVQPPTITTATMMPMSRGRDIRAQCIGER